MQVKGNCKCIFAVLSKNRQERLFWSVFPLQFTIETQDRRGAILSFRCSLIQVDQKILVDFRLSRGCGLEFKKHFAKIKGNCGTVIEKGPINFGLDTIPLPAMG